MQQRVVDAIPSFKSNGPSMAYVIDELDGPFSPQNPRVAFQNGKMRSYV
jgi:hypothetical protein